MTELHCQWAFVEKKPVIDELLFPRGYFEVKLYLKSILRTDESTKSCYSKP